MQWCLEGLEIVNFNYIVNVGIFIDCSILSGGGVNVISVQFLQEVNFYLGILLVVYGNVNIVLLDMCLCKGNNE